MLDKPKSDFDARWDREHAATARIVETAASLAEVPPGDMVLRKAEYLERVADAFEWKRRFIDYDDSEIRDALQAIANRSGFGDLPADLTNIHLAQVMVFVLERFAPKKKSRKT